MNSKIQKYIWLSNKSLNLSNAILQGIGVIILAIYVYFTYLFPAKSFEIIGHLSIVIGVFIILQTLLQCLYLWIGKIQIKKIYILCIFVLFPILYFLLPPNYFEMLITFYFIYPATVFYELLIYKQNIKNDNIIK